MMHDRIKCREWKRKPKAIEITEYLILMLDIVAWNEWLAVVRTANYKSYQIEGLKAKPVFKYFGFMHTTCFISRDVLGLLNWGWRVERWQLVAARGEAFKSKAYTWGVRGGGQNQEFTSNERANWSRWREYITRVWQWKSQSRRWIWGWGRLALQRLSDSWRWSESINGPKFAQVSKWMILRNLLSRFTFGLVTASFLWNRP
jgi:hypothetical protein